MIEARDVHKAFGDVIAVAGASFVADDGRITGLLGPNGAGKTTILRAVVGLARPDAGTIFVDGIEVAARPAAARARLGVLPDARGLYARLSARENVRYYGRLYGLGGAELEHRIDELVTLLDLGAVADRRAAGYSAGERAKVAIARALVHRPRNVVLDEPTVGLDVMSTRALRGFILRLRDEGCCVLYTSHVMQEIAAVCDRIVVMAQGRVVADGTADELRERAGLASLEEAFVKLTLGDRYEAPAEAP
jgi:sodium transport system ATP-binding protein